LQGARDRPCEAGLALRRSTAAFMDGGTPLPRRMCQGYYPLTSIRRRDGRFHPGLHSKPGGLLHTSPGGTIANRARRVAAPHPRQATPAERPSVDGDDSKYTIKQNSVKVFFTLILARRAAANPESIFQNRGYGFPARGLKPAPRNDGSGLSCHLSGMRSPLRLAGTGMLHYVPIPVLYRVFFHAHSRRHSRSHRQHPADQA